MELFFCLRFPRYILVYTCTFLKVAGGSNIYSIEVPGDPKTPLSVVTIQIFSDSWNCWQAQPYVKNTVDQVVISLGDWIYNGIFNCVSVTKGVTNGILLYIGG